MNPPVRDDLLCHRCGATLEPGGGNFYIVRIEAFADPTPQIVEPVPGQIEQLIEELKDSSEREMMDQVYRKMTLHLCRACYERWIEDPTR